MPEGGGQGGGGGGHAVLEGSYELHDTVGTGGFAKVISRLSKFKFCLYHCYSLSCKSLMATWVVGLRNCQYCQNSFLPSACRQVFLRSWLKLLVPKYHITLHWRASLTLQVKLATHLLTGVKVAIKIMDKRQLGEDLPRIRLVAFACWQMSKFLLHQTWNSCNESALSPEHLQASPGEKQYRKWLSSYLHCLSGSWNRHQNLHGAGVLSRGRVVWLHCR